MGLSKSFFCSLVFILCILNLSIHSVAYVSINNITLLGDAYFQENGRICLTSSSSPSSSIGFSFYVTPFSDSSSSPPLFGDGLTFITTSNPYTVGNGFGYMGLSNQTSQEDGMYIAVEFDTRIDINSVMSFASVDSTSMCFDLKNGKRTTMVDVWLSYTKSRTIRPILATHIDLSMYLEEFMFIGFSASNGKGGSAQHVVEKWRFRTYGFLPSTNSVGTTIEGGCFMCVPDDVVLNDTAELPSKRSKKSELALGFGGAAFLVSVLVVIWGISCFF
ncbi:hypothetical protein MKX01_020945 [Papaver californicum]|nr:hypothetical protein MKX01_020945 [Papaver californicum]